MKYSIIAILSILGYSIIIFLLIVCVAFAFRKQKANILIPFPPKMQSPSKAAAPQIGIDSRFAHSQLIGGERFIEAYSTELKALRQSKPFQAYITKLHRELNGAEINDTKNANQKIANSFFYSNINDRFPDVAIIVAAVKEYGKQASAHISIYYAMFITDE